MTDRELIGVFWGTVAAIPVILLIVWTVNRGLDQQERAERREKPAEIPEKYSEAGMRLNALPCHSCGNVPRVKEFDGFSEAAAIECCRQFISSGSREIVIGEWNQWQRDAVDESACPSCGHPISAHMRDEEPPHVCHQCYAESDKSDGYGQRWCSMGEAPSHSSTAVETADQPSASDSPRRGGGTSFQEQ